MPSIDEIRMSEVTWTFMQPQPQQRPQQPQGDVAPQPEPEATSELDGLSTDELYLKLNAAAGTEQYDELMRLYIAAAEAEDGALGNDGFWRPHKADDGLWRPGQEGEPESVPGRQLA